MNNNSYMKHYGMLGLGAFGGNITRPFEEAGYPCIVANSSSEDLAQVRNAKNKIHFNGGSGCHKNRRKSKELLKGNIDILINEVKSKMPEISTLFIFASSGGGTGSGMLAAAAKILKNALNINICVVTTLPSKSEQLKAYSNTIELFRELETISDIGATFVLDNSKHRDKLKINEIFFTHLSALLANENGSVRGAVDRGEIDELLRTPGMAIISKLGKDNSDTQKLITTIKTNNIYAPPESNKVIRYFCLMNSGNGFDISTEQIYSELGTPIDEFIGVGAASTVCIVTGLTLPKARLNEITKTAMANSEIIQKNLEDASKGLFEDDDLGFLGAFDIKKDSKEAVKVSSIDILNEFL